MKKNNTTIPFRHYVKEVVHYIIWHNRPYKKTLLFGKNAPLMIAHRGLSGLEKENTLPAFRLAGERTYYGIETDVHKTADGKYVIIHDDTTGRVAGADMSVEGSTFEALRALKLKDMGGRLSENYKIPSLEEYISTCKEYKKVCILELKNHFEESEVVEIARIIDAMGYLDKTVFISFDLPNLISLRKHYPVQPAQYLTCIYEKDLIEKLKAHNLDLDIYFRELTRARVALLKKSGIKVNCWTVNSLSFARKLSSWGVDYITSNIIE